MYLPPVTIAIPFYNAEKFLLNAIQSVFNQTYQNWELILIDDGSEDNSLKIANSIDDKRVRVLSDGKNLKLASRLNQIAKIAKYDFLVRMDADDLMSKKRIETQINILLKNPEIDLVTTGVLSITNELEIVGKRGVDAKNPSFSDLINRKIGITHAAIIGRKSWFLRNTYDENLSIAQDFDLWLRAAKSDDFKIISISDPLYFYREENNVTAYKLIKAYRNEKLMLKKYKSKNVLLNYFKINLKILIVKFLDKISKIDLLLKRRNLNQLDISQINNFKKEIDEILNTKLPRKL